MTQCTNSATTWKWLKKEGDRIFTGTTFKGKHQIKIDALKSMWTPGCIEWLKKNGMWARIIKPEKGCNDGTTYAEWATAGMSHELMPLDTSLFMDLMAALHECTAASRHLLTGDPLKFDMSTPKRLWLAVARVWEVAPTSARIVQDCAKFDTHIRIVVANKGAKVEGIGDSNGWRGVTAREGRWPVLHPDAATLLKNTIISARNGQPTARTHSWGL